MTKKVISEYFTPKTNLITVVGNPLIGEGNPLTGEGNPLTGEGNPLTGEVNPFNVKWNPLAGDVTTLAERIYMLCITDALQTKQVKMFSVVK